VADWCDQCHRKRGLVVWPDLPRLDEEHPQGEALAALLLDKVDAFEITSFAGPESANLRDYYRLLECGCWPALVGGSGKDSNAMPLGSVRTYAHLSDETLTTDNWATAIRCRHTFVTNGPLLSLGVFGHTDPPARVGVKAGQAVELRAEAQSTLPFDYLELLAGGNLIASKTASGNRLSAVLEAEYIATRSTWIAARCYSAERLATGSCNFAHTMPFWLDVDGIEMVPGHEAMADLLAVLERTRLWVEREADCTSDRQRQHLLGVLDEGRAVLESRRGGLE
jgi:hypothetical protein